MEKIERIQKLITQYEQVDENGKKSYFKYIRKNFFFFFIVFFVLSFSVEIYFVATGFNFGSISIIALFCLFLALFSQVLPCNRVTLFIFGCFTIKDYEFFQNQLKLSIAQQLSELEAHKLIAHNSEEAVLSGKAIEIIKQDLGQDISLVA